MTNSTITPGGASRRAFLGSTAAFTASLVAPRCARSQSVSANGRIGFAFIGLGGMGMSHLQWFVQRDDVDVVALCDVDRRHLDKAKAKVGKDCKAYGDFRELLDQPGIDAVLIATPDHWHALTAIAAAKAGKHVYCEKPLTNSIGEGRALCNAVKDAGVVLQTGSHERSSPGVSIAKRLIREGRFGKIQRVKIQLPTDEPHLQSVINLKTPPQVMETPEELDYNLWLGHTQDVPYTEKRCHFWWRFHSVYGGGEMTDRGAHVIDLAQMILDLDDTGPVHVQASGEASPSGFYDAFIRFNFENRYENGLVMTGDNSGPRGVRFVGTEGSLFVEVHGGALSAEPSSLLDGVEIPTQNAYDSHRRNFLQAVRGDGSVVAPVEAGHRTATICHLNNLCLRLGKAFTWNPSTERSNEADVNERLTPVMREPWSLPT
jgi:predicted dehydrogenase